MMRSRTIWNVAAQFFLGSTALALVTLGFLWLHVGFASASAEVFHLFGLDPKDAVSQQSFGDRILPEDRRRVIEVPQQAARDKADFEEALRKAQAELAQVTRVTMLGEMTGSIAHEINQPPAAVVANSEARLRWLDRGTPDLEAPALPMILGDRVQLQQVVINLVMNDIEAMQSVTDRPLEMVIRSGQHDARRVLVSVTDWGVGISARDADRLFDAFFTSGMGMGLSSCRSTIESLGGRLSASGNEGPGAKFQFVLPMHQEDVS